MKRVIMKTRIVLPVLAIALAMSLAMASTASAALPAPNFMPGFPMLAGPQVILMWTPIPGAVKYRIYFNGKVVGQSVAMQYIIQAPTAGGEYDYQVTAIDASGAESPLSLAGKIKIVIVEPPKGLVARPSEDRIAMRWDVAKGAAIYDLFRRKKGETSWKLLASITEAHYEDTQLEKGVIYEYAIKSKDIAGKSSRYSETLEGTLYVPKAADIRRKKIDYKMHLLPGQFRERMTLPYYPTDVAVHDNAMVIAANGLYFFEDITSEEVFSFYEPILPNEKDFLGVAFSPDGDLIYAAHRKSKQIYVIDPYVNTEKGRGAILDKLSVPAPPSGAQGEPGTLYIEIGGKVLQMAGEPAPFDILIDANGDLVVSDQTNLRVLKMTTEGEYLETIGYSEDEKVSNAPDWAISNPGFLAANSSGRIFASSITTFISWNLDGKDRLVNGGAGSIFGTFATVNGIFIDKKDRLYATDIRNGTIQIFQEYGDKYIPVYSITNVAKNGNVEAQSVLQVVVSSDSGRMFVLESMSKSVSSFDLLWSKADRLELPPLE